MLKKITAFSIETFQSFVVFAAIFSIVYLFIFRPSEVSGFSMIPNLQDGERLIADEISYRFNNPQRGEIIVIKSPEKNSKLLVKRLIGLPGETILIQEGKVYINSKVVKEEYLNQKTSAENATFLPDGKSYTLASDEYFFMGDNRENSLDSREFGPVPRSNIIGRAVLKFWPFSHTGLIKPPAY